MKVGRKRFDVSNAVYLNANGKRKNLHDNMIVITYLNDYTPEVP